MLTVQDKNLSKTRPKTTKAARSKERPCCKLKDKREEERVQSALANLRKDIERHKSRLHLFK